MKSGTMNETPGGIQHMRDRVEHARHVLDTVVDPEIPIVSIRELGILRDVRDGADGAIEVVITPTYSGCPAIGQIAEDIGEALRAAGLTPYRIETALAPAWTTDWITDAARAKLNAYGIAPPSCGDANALAAGAAGAATAGRARGQPGGIQPVQQISRAAQAAAKAQPACPRCGSPSTERLSQFSSTACKALYRCVSCGEPFDYFKPH
jgi:ring-1,2-phenylacetyl-CoA epoxidase subunit PaaD